MDIFSVLSVIGGLACLVVGGEFLVRGASKLASVLGIPPIIIGLTVVAFGTSTPELAVSLEAALSGNADISVANVIGSNIFNILFIMGSCALISPLIIHSQMITREIPIMTGASVLLLIFARNGLIAREEGAILFSLVLIYTIWLIYESTLKRKNNRELLKESQLEFPPIKGTPKTFIILTSLIVGGLGIVMLGADLLVDGATILAKALGVSDAVIGLTIVAAGTSLPEVVASIVATYKGERDIAVGNVVGSNIYNIFAILGITAGISDLRVSPSLLQFDVLVNIAVSILCLVMLGLNKTLTRTGGAFFLGLYIAYTWFLIQSV